MPKLWFIAALLIGVPGLSFVSASAKELPTIVGGESVPASSPMARSTVAVFGAVSHCSATVIDDDIAVTAGHCVRIAPREIRFGPEALAPSAIAVSVDRYVAHPGMDFERREDLADIALLHFQGGVPSGFSKAELLPSGASLSRLSPWVVSGFGSTSESARDFGILFFAMNEYVRRSPGGTEVTLRGRRSGACNGDSGGPAWVKVDEDRFQLWGVDSRSPADALSKCGDLEVYTDLRAFADWIRRTSERLRKGY